MRGFGGWNARNPWGSLGVGTRGTLREILGAGVPTRGQLAVEILEGTPLADGSDLCERWAAGFLDGLRSGNPHLADWPLQMALRDFLADIRSRYDTVMIDCPPNLHLASWASLVASDELIVPLQPEDFGAQGMADVQDSIDRVLAGPNPDLKLLGFLITMANNRLTVHKGFEQLLRSLHGAAVFTTTIPISADFKESIVQRKPVAFYKPRGAAAKAMKALAEEVAARLGSTPESGDAREEAA